MTLEGQPFSIGDLKDAVITKAEWNGVNATQVTVHYGANTDFSQATKYEDDELPEAIGNHKYCFVVGPVAMLGTFCRLCSFFPH